MAKKNPHLLSKSEQRYLTAAVRKHPERFRGELERTNGKPRSIRRGQFIYEQLRRWHPHLLVEWYGPSMKPAPVTVTRLEANDEASASRSAARYYRENGSTLR